MLFISDSMFEGSPLSAVGSPFSPGGGHPRDDASCARAHDPKPTIDDGRRPTDHGLRTTDLRVVLFDIDGTLIKTVRRREYRELIH